LEDQFVLGRKLGIVSAAVAIEAEKKGLAG
jgi:hypothetical protein